MLSSPLLVLALSSEPLLLPPPPDPRPGWAFGIGAAIEAISFAIGVGLVGSDTAGFDQARAGWMTCSVGFSLAPFVAHGIVGHWARGAIFTALPVAAAVGNAIVLLPPTDTIDVTPLKQDQRLVWAFTSVGLAASIAGLIDVLVIPPKNFHVTPSVSPTGGSLFVGGTF